MIKSLQQKDIKWAWATLKHARPFKEPKKS